MRSGRSSLQSATAEATPPDAPAFTRLQRCYERWEEVTDAFFDLADAIIAVRNLIRQAWVTHRLDSRPARRR